MTEGKGRTGGLVESFLRGGEQKEKKMYKKRKKYRRVKE